MGRNPDLHQTNRPPDLLSWRGKSLPASHRPRPQASNPWTPLEAGVLARGVCLHERTTASPEPTEGNRHRAICVTVREGTLL